jgi:hypothetical protein
VIQIDDQNVPFAPDQADPDDRTAPRIEIFHQKTVDFLVGLRRGNDPEERLGVEPGDVFPARVEEAFPDTAGEDGLGVDGGPHGCGQADFIEAPVEFDDHANLLVGELLGQDLQ